MPFYRVTFQRRPKTRIVIRVDATNIYEAERKAWDQLFKLHRDTTHKDWFMYSIVEG